MHKRNYVQCLMRTLLNSKVMLKDTLVLSASQNIYKKADFVLQMCMLVCM